MKVVILKFLKYRSFIGVGMWGVGGGEKLGISELVVFLVFFCFNDF